MSAAETTTSISPLRRSAMIAMGITAFMLVFRPFGITIDNVAAFAVVLGLAPLNFAVMLIVHMAPSRGRRIGAVRNFGAITLANIAYISLLTGERFGVATSVKVALVALLVATAVGLWNRERSLRREVLELKARPVSADQEVIVLRGEGDKEILRLAPAALHYVRANGNYVDVHFLKGAAPEKTMLRATLAGISDQSPDGALLQCHRSYLVNLAAPQRLVSVGGAMDIEFSDGAQVPVSRSFRKAIRAAAAQ